MYEITEAEFRMRLRMLSPPQTSAATDAETGDAMWLYYSAEGTLILKRVDPYNEGAPSTDDMKYYGL